MIQTLHLQLPNLTFPSLFDPHLRQELSFLTSRVGGMRRTPWKFRVLLIIREYLFGFICRSEGEAERDIGSPCMIGLGLVVVEKFFRRRRRRRRRRRPPGGWAPEN